MIEVLIGNKYESYWIKVPNLNMILQEGWVIKDVKGLPRLDDINHKLDKVLAILSSLEPPEEE